MKLIKNVLVVICLFFFIGYLIVAIAGKLFSIIEQANYYEKPDDEDPMDLPFIMDQNPKRKINYETTGRIRDPVHLFPSGRHETADTIDIQAVQVYDILQRIVCDDRHRVCGRPGSVHETARSLEQGLQNRRPLSMEV